jgi:hypothetical protein
MADTDALRYLLFNAGEQGVSKDFVDLQKHLRMLTLDFLTLPMITNAFQDETGTIVSLDPEHSRYALGKSSNVVPIDVALTPFPTCGVFDTPTAGKVQVLSPGPIMQVVRSLDSTVDLDPDNPAILTYWMKENEALLTIANGDASHDRYDVVEMKLELVDSTETRVYAQDGVKADLDLSLHTTNCDAKVQARVAGVGGDNISLAFVADGTGAGSLTQSGNDLTFHFQDAVTTVDDFDTAVNGSTLIEVEDIGTKTNVLHTVDAFSLVRLSGGVNPILTSATLAKSRKVQATFQVKQGVAAATPSYPACDAGFVPLFGIKVPSGSGSNPVTTANIIDMRWPLGGVRPYDVLASGFGLGDWALSDVNAFAAKTDVTGSMNALCPAATRVGRVIGVGLYGKLNNDPSSSIVAKQVQVKSENPNTVNVHRFTALETALKGAGSDGIYAFASAVNIMDDNTYLSGVRASNTRNGNPLWTNGGRSGVHDGLSTVTATSSEIDRLGLFVESVGSAHAFLSFIRFFVAHGMG